MTRFVLALAMTGLLAPAAFAQDGPAPAPVVIPAPDSAVTDPAPDAVTPARKTGCGRDRGVMS